MFYGTDTNPIRLRSPVNVKSGANNPVPVAHVPGRDLSGLTAPPSVATPSAATFSNIGKGPVQQNNGPLFFPGTSGFRPSVFPNTGFPDFLQFAGSEQVTEVAPLDATTESSIINKSSCPKYSLYGY